MGDQRTFLSLFSFEKLLPFDEKMHNFGARRVTACVIENSDTHIATFYVLHGTMEDTLRGNVYVTVPAPTP